MTSSEPSPSSPSQAEEYSVPPVAGDWYTCGTVQEPEIQLKLSPPPIKSTDPDQLLEVALTSASDAFRVRLLRSWRCSSCLNSGVMCLSCG
jgi:hypothetical protein